MLYDILVRRRQDRITKKAAKSSAIVASLFPEEVRGRLFQDHQDDGPKNKPRFGNPKSVGDDDEKPRGAPVADL